jgi:hypothetical protein
MVSLREGLWICFDLEEVGAITWIAIGKNSFVISKTTTETTVGATDTTERDRETATATMILQHKRQNHIQSKTSLRMTEFSFMCHPRALRSKS